MLQKLKANFGLKVLSLLIAVILWFVVLGSRNVEVTKDVPVEIITPADLVVANDVADKIAYRLSGPKAFLRNIVNRKENPIRINLTASKPGLVTYRFFSDNIEIPIGVKVVSINPTSMVIKLENLKRKEVPVRLVTKGEVEPGFKLTRAELLKTSVRVKGAESRIEQVGELTTMPLDLSQIHESGEREIAVDLSRFQSVVVDGDLPRVRFEMVHSLSQFKIRNAGVKVLTSRKFQVSPEDLTIFVQANPSDLKSLDRSKVFGFVDLRQKGPGSYEVPVSVQLPSNLKLIKVLPARVKVRLL